MSAFDPEQFVAIQTRNAATLFALTNQAFDSFEKLIELNMQTTRSALAESETYWREALSYRTPEDFFTRRTSLMQQTAEQALSYSRQVADILSKLYADWVKAVCVQQEHYTSTTQSLVESIARNAPAGTEIATTMMKSVFSTASSSGETVRKAAEQAIEAAKNAAKQ